MVLPTIYDNGSDGDPGAGFDRAAMTFTCTITRFCRRSTASSGGLAIPSWNRRRVISPVATKQGALARSRKARGGNRAVAQKKDLGAEKFLITAGPNREPLDPVRYISNRSSGKMGYALARAAVRRGAESLSSAVQPRWSRRQGRV